MVQYYRDMWTKRSEMLAPLSDLVGECGETKTTRKNKVKKRPWHWDSIHQRIFDNVKSAIIKEVVPAYPDWSPNENKLYSETGTPHMGIFEPPCPFLYGNHHVETVIPKWKTFPYGDFYLNPQMGMNSIQKRVSDWTVPIRKWGPVSIQGSPFRNWYPFHLLPHTEMGIEGETPFP